MVAILGCGLSGTLAAVDDEYSRLVAERETAVTRAETTFAAAYDRVRASYDAEVARADAAALRELDRVVRRAMQRGEVATVARGWRAVLSMDREHVEARAFFEALGQLEVVLAEIDAAATPVPAAPGLNIPMASTVPQAPSPDDLARALRSQLRQVRLVSALESRKELPLRSGVELGSGDVSAQVGTLVPALVGLRVLSMQRRPSLIDLQARQAGWVGLVVSEQDLRPLINHQGWVRIEGFALPITGSHRLARGAQYALVVKRLEPGTTSINVPGWSWVLY